MAVAKKAEAVQILVRNLDRETTRLRIIGTTPLYQNRMSAKVKHQLLVGGGKKTAAERAGIKHDPLSEYRDSAERLADGPTALGVRVVAPKAAMATAALDTPGLKKSSIQRLVFMPNEFAPLYGVPQLRLDVVRSADINRTPDIRSRCYLPQWGCEIEISYVVPQLSLGAIVTLLNNAGKIVGIGDNRQEKGKGSFGLWRVIGDGENDAEWDDLVANQGRGAQTRALEAPEYANDETAELMAHFFAETKRRAT